MKKTILLVIVALGLIFFAGKLFFGQKSYLTTPAGNLTEVPKEIEVSKTLKSYTDPSGFTFSYPDNLSLVSNEATQSSTYADIKLTANGTQGSLSLKIIDSKYKTLEDWAKATSDKTPKEAMLGNLKASEITTNDKLILGAVDQGVLFNIEVTLGENKDFWMSVYKSVITDFSFAPPTKDTASSGDNTSDSGVSFEGEEVVE